jgi:hypothetical protein
LYLEYRGARLDFFNSSASWLLTILPSDSPRSWRNIYLDLAQSHSWFLHRELHLIEAVQVKGLGALL